MAQSRKGERFYLLISFLCAYGDCLYCQMLSAQCPRRTLLRQWAQIAAMSDVTLSAMPPSPKGRHRAWRKRFRRWWPGDSGKTVHCGGLAPLFEGASPRTGVAPSPRDPAASTLGRYSRRGSTSSIPLESSARVNVAAPSSASRRNFFASPASEKRWSQKLSEGLSRCWAPVTGTIMG